MADHRMFTTEEEEKQWREDLLDGTANTTSKEEAEQVAVSFGTTLDAVQSICGDTGHEWTHYEAGDGAFFTSGTDFCGTCYLVRFYED